MKPRSNSTLKTLPEPMQAAIAAHAESHGISAALHWLRARGVATSRTAMDRWLRWYRYQSRKSERPEHGRPRKPVAALKRLPVELQAALADYARQHSLAEAVAWLAVRGIHCSQMTVSRWYRWYQHHATALGRGMYMLPQRVPQGRMKPHPQSRLKTLPESVQGEIWDYAQSHSLEDTARWLRERGIKTSRSAISSFLSWYAMRRQLEKNETVVQAVLEHLKLHGAGWTEEQLAQAGQAFFTALALEQQDVRAWAAAQRIALQREQLRLDRERLDFLRQRAEQADRAEEVARSELTDAEKLQRMKEIFGL